MKTSKNRTPCDVVRIIVAYLVKKSQVIGFFSLWFAIPGHRQRVWRGPDQALVCEPLHEWPILLQFVEAAAERAEGDAGLCLWGVCQRGPRRLLSDCRYPAQRGRSVYTRWSACTRLTYSSHGLFILCVMLPEEQDPLQVSRSGNWGTWEKAQHMWRHFSWTISVSTAKNKWMSSQKG